jgi:hypothetical protein
MTTKARMTRIGAMLSENALEPYAVETIIKGNIKMRRDRKSVVMLVRSERMLTQIVVRMIEKVVGRRIRKPRFGNRLNIGKSPLCATPSKNIHFVQSLPTT